MGLSKLDKALIKTTGCLPTRIVVAIMTFLGCINLYMVRVNLSVNIVAMVRQNASQAAEIEGECATNSSGVKEKWELAVSSEDIEEETLKYHHTENIYEDVQEGELEWNEIIQGVVLASFFYGYTLTQVIGGRLAEKYVTKRVFGICILAGGFSAILAPIASRTHFAALIALRTIQGIFQGVAWPSLHVLIVRWIPPLERGRFIAIVICASAISITVTLPLCGLLIDALGWAWAFYIPGALSLAWCIHWFIFMHDTPAVHPRISSQEKNYIETAIRTSGTSEIPPASAPWKKIALSMPVWANVVCDIGNAFGFTLCITHIPTYMKNILGFSIKENGLLSAAPFLSRYIGGIMASTLGDWLLARQLISIVNNRRLFSAIAMFGPALMVIGVAYSGCNSAAAITLLCLTMFFNGSISTSLFVNHCDIAPNFSGKKE
ncbi:hypothetical protein SK128_002758 [Halocaridina rubra]|uniref:Major facilitator superfamily (MFS) profile domain-containing protein n=1 Tax=Halocaridina rubra TaxID=373956 RepID=A0AAN8ZX55_HALRR